MRPCSFPVILVTSRQNWKQNLLGVGNMSSEPAKDHLKHGHWQSNNSRLLVVKIRQRCSTTWPFGAFNSPTLPFCRTTLLLYWLCLQCRCSQTIGVDSLIDSRFALFGLERGPPSVWLRCTALSQIFHDCVGYRAANHMCYPLSGAAAMA